MTRKSLDLHEIVALLEESDEDVDDVQITLFPPSDGPQTDEESGEESTNDMNRLPGRLLRSAVEIETRNKKHLPESVTQMVSQAATSKKISKRKKRNIVARNWLQNEEDFVNKSGSGDKEESIFQYNGPTFVCVDWFEKQFSIKLVEMIRDQSNVYTLQRNHQLNVTTDEIKVYLGILLLTGYMVPKYMRMFWETQSDVHNSLVSSSMRRNRFFEIQQFLHLADNSNLIANDKFAKVRPYLSLLNDNFKEYFDVIGSSHLSIDETMVPYYGKHSAKQHIHGKPIKFGYKLWSASTSSGYLVTFEPYQGSKHSKLPKQEELGLGAAVVMELQSRLPQDKGPYNLYFDRFFTSLKLIEALSEINVGGTGTVQENRIEKCPLQNSKALSKQVRGSYSFNNTDSAAVVKWHDNNIVTAISNCHSIHPMYKVDRIGTVSGRKQKLQIECPNIIKKYNVYMGVVDRFDENLHSLRVSLRGRKWWYPLFAFGLDAACQNAWLLRRFTEPSTILTYCDFRRAILQEYLFKYQKPPKHTVTAGNIPKHILNAEEIRAVGGQT